MKLITRKIPNHKDIFTLDVVPKLIALSIKVKRLF